MASRIADQAVADLLAHANELIEKRNGTSG